MIMTSIGMRKGMSSRMRTKTKRTIRRCLSHLKTNLEWEFGCCCVDPKFRHQVRKGEDSVERLKTFAFVFIVTKIKHLYQYLD